jgi:Family of unknown function (DUF6194)
VTEEEVIRFVSGLPAVVAMTADKDSGAPEIAWGDTFFFHEADRKMPFATIVVKDYPGWDTASNLDRPGVFRVNAAVGRERFAELFGYPPAAHAEHAGEFDYTALDTVIPHPVYAVQGWVSILNPSGDKVRPVLTAAHERAVRRNASR